VKRALRFLVAALLSVVTLSVELSAWGDAGHQIVARIAARRLLPQTKMKIVALARAGAGDLPALAAALGAVGSPQPNSTNFKDALAAMAIWPDHMPNGKGATEPWHFTDFGLFEGTLTTADRCPVGCVTQLIPTLIKNIAAGTSITDGTRTFGPDKELRFLIHFLGDIHQPLHVSTNADAGGNCEQTTGFDDGLELHASWDRSMVRLVMRPTQEGTVTALLAEFGGDVLAAGVTDASQIADEGFAIAKRNVYAAVQPQPIPIIDHFVDLRPPECGTKAPAEIRSVIVNGPLSFSNDPTKLIVRKQLFRAGVRLATVLNALFM
jgi:S1/P1 nuclease